MTSTATPSTWTDRLWNEEARAELVELLREGKFSRREIAIKLKRTRNSIIGAINRHFPEFTERKPRGPKAPPRIARIRKPRKVYTRQPEPARPPKLTAPLSMWADISMRPGGGLTLMQLRSSGQCKWPIGDPSDFANFRYCAAVTDEPERAYCPCHRALSVGNGTPSERRADDMKDLARREKVAA